ncbi:hypothetical protein QJS10_CPB20g01942 [Acorus calamus]|uniref:Uncharacterized protein n=1 Tax=Acorus calamus TaxID=4465 RepID=A0AAV9CAW3_ACOCL|nr:hypothetical protein QJS10_CPB20g01942 [Acorus calamus]
MEAVLSVVLILSSLRSVLPSSPYLGIAPKELKYFAGEVTACRDGSGTFKKDRLNDGFCDCPDGTDEPELF